MPHSLTAFLDRLAQPHGLGGELDALAPLGGTLVPLEASVSLDRGASQSELRCTLGVPATPEDPHGRAGLRAASAALGAGPASAAADDVLTRVARGGPKRGYVRALALRARRGEVRPRIASWVGGDTVVERSSRITDALHGVGLHGAAESHADIANLLACNPFSATIPYGLGLALARDGIRAAKPYFACESAEVLLGHVHGPVAHALGLEGATKPLDSLVAVAGSAWRQTRWFLEASFELPADPSAAPRVKLYIPPARLAASDCGPHRAVLRLAADLGLDSTPYEELIGALGHDAHRPTVMAGVSVSAAGFSVEAYVFVRLWERNPSTRVKAPYIPAEA